MTNQSPSQIFHFQSQHVRTTIIDNQPWFVAKDVCAVLGIKWSGHTLGAIPAPWQGVVKLTTPSGSACGRGGGNQRLRIINEAALYKLAFRSNKPSADAFTNWVVSEVLPAIRQTGKYEAKPKAAPKPKALPKPANPHHELIDRASMVLGGLKEVRTLLCNPYIYNLQRKQTKAIGDYNLILSDLSCALFQRLTPYLYQDTCQTTLIFAFHDSLQEMNRTITLIEESIDMLSTRQ